jgi:hypothetical protein
VTSSGKLAGLVAIAIRSVVPFRVDFLRGCDFYDYRLAILNGKFNRSEKIGRQSSELFRQYFWNLHRAGCSFIVVGVEKRFRIRPFSGQDRCVLQSQQIAALSVGFAKSTPKEASGDFRQACSTQF